MTAFTSLARAGFLRTTPKVDGHLVLAFMGAHTLLLAILFHPTYQIYVSIPVSNLTAGLVPHILSGSILQLVVLVGGLAVLAGGLRLQHLGLRWNAVLNGVLITLLVWGAAQLFLFALAALGSSHPILNPVLNSQPDSTAVGRVFLAPFGNALVEEVLYRGFLFPQLYLLAGMWGSMTRGRRLVVAVGASQGFFGVNHISAGRTMGLGHLDLALYLLQVACVGAFFAVLYLRTENLLAVAGVHALINNPLSFYLSPVNPSLVIILLGLALMFWWPAFDRWSRTTSLVTTAARWISRPKVLTF